MSAQWLAAAVLWLAPVLGGAADRPYSLLIVGLCGLAALRTSQSQDVTVRASLASLGLLWAAGLSLLQIIPLPPTLRALLAPGSDADLRQILSGLDGAPTWLPLSIDASSTLNEAAGLFGMLCLLLAFGSRDPGEPATPDHRPDSPAVAPVWRSPGWVVLAATMVSALGVLAAVGVPLPSPIGVPGQGTTRAVFPAGLHNSNHMAALCGLGALLALSYALSTSRGERRPYRVWATLACGLCNLALLGTLSRAGVLCWGAAQLALVVCVIRRTMRQAAGQDSRWKPWVRRLWLLPLVLTALWAALPDGTLDSLAYRFSPHELRGVLQPGSKVYAWFEALPILRGHLWLGVGHGAGENLFQHSHVLSGRMRFVYLENQWLQLVFDFGLLGAVPLLLLAVGFVVDAQKKGANHPAERLPYSVPLASWLGLAALGLHNLFDFNTAVLGVSLPALVLVGVVERRRTQLPRPAVTALGIGTLLMAALAWWVAPSHDEEGAWLRRLAADPSTPTDVLLSRATAAVLRHPFDSHLSAVVAARLVQQDHPAARAWLNRALLANPRDTLALRQTALRLATAGQLEEALLFLRQAIEHGDPEEQQRSLRLVADIATDAETARSALPHPADLDALLDVAGAQSPPRWSLIWDLASQGLRVGQPATRAAYWLGRSALAQGTAPQIESALAALLADPVRAPVLLVADLLDRLADLGQTEDAQRLALIALQKQPAPEWQLALARIQLRISPPAWEHARALLAEVLSRPSSDVPRPLQARAHDLLADLESAAGNLHAALAHRQAAAALRAMDARVAP